MADPETQIRSDDTSGIARILGDVGGAVRGFYDRGGLAGVLGMEPWYGQRPLDIAMGFAGGTGLGQLPPQLARTMLANTLRAGSKQRKLQVSGARGGSPLSPDRSQSQLPALAPDRRTEYLRWLAAENAKLAERQGLPPPTTASEAADRSKAELQRLLREAGYATEPAELTPMGGRLGSRLDGLLEDVTMRRAIRDLKKRGGEVGDIAAGIEGAAKQYAEVGDDVIRNGGSLEEADAAQGVFVEGIPSEQADMLNRAIQRLSRRADEVTGYEAMGFDQDSAARFSNYFRRTPITEGQQ